MQITIHGGTIRRRNLAHNLLTFLNDFNKEFDRDIKVSLKIKPGDNCDGSCQLAGKNRFLLIVDPNVSVKRFIEVVIHEYTHIRQTYSDGCITDCAGKTIWRGKTYCKKYIDPDQKEYWLAPWEIEAVGMQNIISDYIEHKLDINLDSLTWNNCQSLITAIKGLDLR